MLEKHDWSGGEPRIVAGVAIRVAFIVTTRPVPSSNAVLQDARPHHPVDALRWRRRANTIPEVGHTLVELWNVTLAQRAKLGVALGVVALTPVAGQGRQITVTLLGTGCPPAVMNRFGPSTLVDAGGQKFVFDAGRGALQRLTQLGVRWQDVQGVFLTHLHSDHVVGFPDLWLTGWLVAPGRTVPLPVWGPSGTSSMMLHLEQAYQADIDVRIANDGAASDGVKIVAHDIAEGVVYDRGGVKVTAFEVDHAAMRPAFGYRIDYGGHSVVLSGDTRVSENLIRHAQGVDVLVHEVFVPSTLARAGVPPDRAKNIIAYHLTPEEAGQVFTRTRPKLAVYSHVCLPTAVSQDVLVPTRTTYSGPLELGEDLMVIDVGEKVAVRRPAVSSP